jgi:hypothetical protein
VIKPVSKCAFQVHNLQRYKAAASSAEMTILQEDLEEMRRLAVVGLCTLNEVDP